jgi:hypothetical protein
LNQERRADEQHQREREFADDQQAAQARRAAGRGRRAPRLANDLVEIDVRSLDRRREAEEDARCTARAPCVNASTVQLTPTSCSRGRLDGLSCTRPSTPQTATNRPSAPPTAASSTLSVSS